MNYLLGQLEARGYLERRTEKGSSRRLVFLTDRGWQVRETILAVVAGAGGMGCNSRSAALRRIREYASTTMVDPAISDSSRGCA
jgi:hypothetical protein